MTRGSKGGKRCQAGAAARNCKFGVGALVLVFGEWQIHTKRREEKGAGEGQVVEERRRHWWCALRRFSPVTWHKWGRSGEGGGVEGKKLERRWGFGPGGIVWGRLKPERGRVRKEPILCYPDRSPYQKQRIWLDWLSSLSISLFESVGCVDFDLRVLLSLITGESDPGEKRGREGVLLKEGLGYIRLWNN
jgi:hypothetical protein